MLHTFPDIISTSLIVEIISLPLTTIFSTTSSESYPFSLQVSSGEKRERGGREGGEGGREEREGGRRGREGGREEGKEGGNG